MSEVTPLLATTTPGHEPEEHVSMQERLGRRLESSTAHWIVIALTTLDALFVLCDIGYDFLKDQRCICTDSCPEDPAILGILSLFSLAITSLFLIEIPLSLYCFGSQHYTSVTHAYPPSPPVADLATCTDLATTLLVSNATVHLFDAAVITVTFCLEVFLRGREAEIAGLLRVTETVLPHKLADALFTNSVLLRLWRLIKLVSTVSVDVTEYNDVEQRPNSHTPSTLPQEAADWWAKEKQELLDELKRVKAELEQAKIALFGNAGAVN